MRASALVALAALLAGCSGGGTGPGHETDAKVVQVSGFSFLPATVTVKQGDTVVFQNAHDRDHTATMDSGERDTGPIAPGDEKAFSLPTPGRHAYHCAIHPTMSGTIVVEE